jgi:hypothetical protein
VQLPLAQQKQLGCRLIASMIDSAAFTPQKKGAVAMGWFSRKPRIPKDIQAKYHPAYVAGYDKGRKIKDTEAAKLAAVQEGMKHKFHSGDDTPAYRDAYDRGFEDGCRERVASRAL